MNGTKTIKYFEASLGRYVEKEITVPPRAKVKAFASGLTVEEIPDVKLGESSVAMLGVPLTAHTRNALQVELLKVITSETERAAILDLCQTWQVTDDRALKLIGRLITENGQRTEETMARSTTVARLEHEKALWEQDRSKYKDEVKALNGDVKKLVEERDALKNNKCSKSLYDRIVTLEATKVQLIEERDALMRDAQRNVEIALVDYENEVMKRLGSVAEEHNKKAKEVNDLKKEIVRLKDQVKRDNEQVKERNMSENENTTEAVEVETLSAGDEVYCKVSGDGPFVLMTQVDEATVEYSNPIANKKNAFSVGNLPVLNAWLVRCKDATFRTLPAPALTKIAPKSTMSFGGVKRLVTSDVTSKLFQAAIWVTMLTLLFMRG